MSSGQELLHTIHSLPPADAVAAMLRHAARYPIADPTDPTQAELTPEGAQSAVAFGTRIRGFGQVRLFHSPVKRCRQTAECIARGAGAAGLAVDLVGAQEELGIDYIFDLPEAGRLTAQHGEHLVRLWFSGQVAPTVLRPARAIATDKLGYLAARLREPVTHGRRLDLHISHDWNILILRELMLGVRHEDTGWLEFLDGVVFTAMAERLRAVYRQTNTEQPLPWRFAG